MLMLKFSGSKILKMSFIPPDESSFSMRRSVNVAVWEPSFDSPDPPPKADVLIWIVKLMLSSIDLTLLKSLMVIVCGENYMAPELGRLNDTLSPSMF